MKLTGRAWRPRQPHRRAWWNKAISLVAAVIVIGTLPLLLRGGDTAVAAGRLVAVVGFAVVMKWGYWRNRP